MASISITRVVHHIKSEVLYPLTPQITYETLFERVSVSNDNFAKRYDHVQLERQKGMTLIISQTVRLVMRSSRVFGVFFSRETNFEQLHRRSRHMFTVSRKLALLVLFREACSPRDKFTDDQLCHFVFELKNATTRKACC